MPPGIKHAEIQSATIAAGYGHGWAAVARQQPAGLQSRPDSPMPRHGRPTASWRTNQSFPNSLPLNSTIKTNRFVFYIKRLPLPMGASACGGLLL
jgi:hypothetical protein